MAIRRQKIDRKANLVTDGARIVDMPPDWAFSIDCPHHGRVSFDFTSFRSGGREALAAQMRDAVWSMRHEVGGRTLKNYWRYIGYFWQFLQSVEMGREPVTRLDQIDRQLIDDYLVWLEHRVVPTGKKKGQRWSVGTKKKARDVLKAVLINRQKRVPDAVSPNLSFPRNPFPNSNRMSVKRESYSVAEQKRILDALNTDLRTIHEGKGDALPDSQVLVVHLLLLGLSTGRNLQSLLELRRDSLQEHPLSDRELLVTHKRRGWTTHAMSIRKPASPKDQSTLHTIPASVGDHFRFLCDFTAPLSLIAPAEVKQFAFLRMRVRGSNKGQVWRMDHTDAGNMIETFVRRHSLVDDNGQVLALNIARTRPTFATELYRRTRDIRRVQQALGHATAETTARHYVEQPLEAERDHALVLDGMVCQFTRLEVEGKVLIAADGKIPAQDMKDLLAGGYNTGVARCRNPFRGKEGQESVCKKFFACFKCPSMCVFEDDLWRLFSFYYRLLAERTKINPAHWLKTFGPIIRRIDVDIASQFPSQKVAEARQKAQQNPHPTWRGPLL